MNVEGTGLARFGRIIPGTRRKLHDLRPHGRRDDRAGEAGTAIVEYANDIAGAYAARVRVDRMDPDRLTPADLGFATQCTVVELTVKARRGLVGDEMQGKPSSRGIAQPFLRRQPDGMAETVRVAVARDSLAEQLDPARGRVERVAGRITAIFAKENELVLRCGDLYIPDSSERIERRHMSRLPLKCASKPRRAANSTKMS